MILVNSIKFLVKSGANLESKDKWGGTPIMLATNCTENKNTDRVFLFSPGL